MSGTFFIDFGSTAGSSRDFQAEGLFRFGKPGIVSKRATAIKSTLGCGKLLVSLSEVGNRKKFNQKNF